MVSIPVFVISLKRAADRRSRMLAHLAQIGVTPRLVDAVDGRMLSDQERASALAPGVNLHAGAVGCYMSHLKVYQSILSENIPVALVLEDDARLNPAFIEILKAGCESKSFDYCFLDSDDHNDKYNIYFDEGDSIPISGSIRAHRLSAGPQTLHAYMISLGGARKRLESAYPIIKAIDLYDHLTYPIIFRAIVSPKMAWVSEESLVSSTSERSVSASSLNFSWLRKSYFFYRVRDILKMKSLGRRIQAKAMMKKGVLPTGHRWRPLPSGREVVL